MIDVRIDNQYVHNGYINGPGTINMRIRNTPNSTIDSYLKQIDENLSDSLIIGLGTDGNKSVLVFVVFIDPKGHKEIYNFKPNISLNSIYGIYVIIGGEPWEKEYYRNKYNYLLGIKDGQYDYSAIRYIMNDYQGYPYIPDNDIIPEEYLDEIGYDEKNANIIRNKYSEYIYDLINGETFGILETYFQ